MEKKVEIRARSVVKEAIDRFVESFLRRALVDEVEHLQNKVASRSVILRFSDGSAIVARVGVVFGPMVRQGRMAKLVLDEGEVRVTDRPLEMREAES